MRVALEQILGKLACPRCQQPLSTEGSVFSCSGKDCRYHTESFPNAGQQPVLVDFDTSILERDDTISGGAASPVSRNASTVAGALKKLILGQNPVAPQNEREFIALAGAMSDRPTILVVGGATAGSGVSEMYERDDVDVIAFDIYATNSTQFVADAHHIPLLRDSVDAVWIQAVLEHVLTPAEVVAEIYRVLRPAGLVYAETPFMQHVHEHAYDFTRFTHSGHRWLFRDFEEIDSGVVDGVGTQLLWSIDFFCRGVLRSARVGKLARLLFWPIRLFDRIAGRRQTIAGASGFYFLGRRSDQALTPHDMPSYYQGV